MQGGDTEPSTPGAGVGESSVLCHAELHVCAPARACCAVKASMACSGVAVAHEMLRLCASKMRRSASGHQGGSGAALGQVAAASPVRPPAATAVRTRALISPQIVVPLFSAVAAAYCVTASAHALHMRWRRCHCSIPDWLCAPQLFWQIFVVSWGHITDMFISTVACTATPFHWCYKSLLALASVCCVTAPPRHLRAHDCDNSVRHCVH